MGNSKITLDKNGKIMLISLMELIGGKDMPQPEWSAKKDRSDIEPKPFFSIFFILQIILDTSLTL